MKLTDDDKGILSRIMWTLVGLGLNTELRYEGFVMLTPMPSDGDTILK